MVINNDYLVWFSTRWMKQNMCASCRILHDPIVFRNLLWWGNMPSLSIGSESMRVYVHEATDGWIFLKVLPRFPYVRTGSDDSIYDTSIIKVADIPRRNSPYYVAYVAPNMRTISLCIRGSPYANFVLIPPHVHPFPAHMHMGIPICTNLAIFSDILHDFLCRLWYVCIWGSPYA